MSAPPVVGEIFNPSTYIPPFTQPGGPGTAVFPAQDTGQLVGQWTAGCQHSFQCWQIYSCAINGVQAAIVCCPVCNYCQQIITPYNAIYSFPFEVIFG
jgi:hypothetical protein